MNAKLPLLVQKLFVPPQGLVKLSSHPIIKYYIYKLIESNLDNNYSHSIILTVKHYKSSLETIFRNILLGEWYNNKCCWQLFIFFIKVVSKFFYYGLLTIFLKISINMIHKLNITLCSYGLVYGDSGCWSAQQCCKFSSFSFPVV